MRIYEVDIVVEAANLKFMTKTFAVRLAEFILGVQQAEPALITGVTTKIADYGKVVEKQPIGDSVAVGIPRVWVCTRSYKVFVSEVGDLPEDGVPITTSEDVRGIAASLVDINVSLSTINKRLGNQDEQLTDLMVWRNSLPAVV